MLSPFFLFEFFLDNQAATSTPPKVTTPAARPRGSVIDLTEDDDDDVQGKKMGWPSWRCVPHHQS